MGLSLETYVLARKYTDKEITKASAELKWKTVVCEELPPRGAPQTYYFVPVENPSAQDYYDEYIWIDNLAKFEKMGSTQVITFDSELSDESENAVQNKVVKAAIDTKVDKVTGKQLSTEDYTTAEKTKLAGIEAGAQVNTITGIKGDAEENYRVGNVNITPANIGLGNVDNTSDINKPISTATQTALDGKVDKVTGKQLSTNDYTTAEKEKLAGIEAGAQVNQNAYATVKVGENTISATTSSDTIEYAAGSNITLTPANKTVTISATDTKYTTTDSEIGSASGWNPGTIPAFGDNILADEINSWDQGTLPNIGLEDGHILTFNAGTLPTLQKTQKTIPNVVNAGTLPQLTITPTSVITSVTEV